MAPDLTTTNVLLGIIAAVSVLEAAAVIAIVGAMAIVGLRVTRLLQRISQDQIAPAAARVNAILDDVKDVSSRVKEEVGRLDAVAAWVVDLFQRGRVRQP
jgi:hypothetical protein